MKKNILWISIIVVVAVVVGYYYWKKSKKPATPPAAPHSQEPVGERATVVASQTNTLDLIGVQIMMGFDSLWKLNTQHPFSFPSGPDKSTARTIINSELKKVDPQFRETFLLYAKDVAGARKYELDYGFDSASQSLMKQQFPNIVSGTTAYSTVRTWVLNKGFNWNVWKYIFIY